MFTRILLLICFLSALTLVVTPIIGGALGLVWIFKITFFSFWSLLTTSGFLAIVSVLKEK